MAKVTPAMITYTVNGVEGKLRFHTVVSEAHEAYSDITKFPVQSGFMISNHAIRRNRVITLEGIISNTVLANTNNSITYSLNNSKTVFEEMEALVNSATICEVTTNLGNYSPVVFSKFITKQAAGLTDCMQFTIRGEEVQVRSILNKTAPKLISFTEVPPSEYAARLAELKAMGYVIPFNANITQSKMSLGKDFKITTPNSKGTLTTLTYIVTGYNWTTDEYTYEVHETPAEVVAAAPTTAPNFWSIAGKAGSALSSCLVEGAIDVAIDRAEETIESYKGKARKTLYGLQYDIMKLGGNVVGKALTGVLVDCIVSGAKNAFDDVADAVLPEGSAIRDAKGLPTTQNIVDGITKMGQAVEKIPIKEMTLTKIAGFGVNL